MSLINEALKRSEAERRANSPAGASPALKPVVTAGADAPTNKKSAVPRPHTDLRWRIALGAFGDALRRGRFSNSWVVFAACVAVLCGGIYLGLQSTDRLRLLFGAASAQAGTAPGEGDASAKSRAPAEPEAQEQNTDATAQAGPPVEPAPSQASPAPTADQERPLSKVATPIDPVTQSQNAKQTAQASLLVSSTLEGVDYYGLADLLAADAVANPASADRAGVGAGQPKEAPAAKPTASAVSFRLSAIMRGPDGVTAIINGKFVTVGDTVDGATLIKLGKHTAELQIRGRNFSIQM